MLKCYDAFAEVRKQILDLVSTEKTETICAEDNFLFDVKDIAKEGMSQIGTKLSFPPMFIDKLNNDGHEDLSTTIINTRLNDYFHRNRGSKLFKRDFSGKTYGLLSERYAFFDDDEILPILERSEYLMNECENFWCQISPVHTHLRFVSKNKLYIDGDDSPLSMCVFIDNSMIGMSSFKIRFGIYRWACTNGMISNLKEFTILKETHIGEKDFTSLTIEALEEARNYEQMLLDKVIRMRDTKCNIYGMTEEDAKKEIQNYLDTSKKVAKQIYEAFLFYGGVSQWDLCNAITEVAHERPLDERLKFEAKGFEVRALKAVA